MKITDDDVMRFQEIWREEFKEEIGEDEARDHITQLDALYLMLYKTAKVENGCLANIASEAEIARRGRAEGLKPR